MFNFGLGVQFLLWSSAQDFITKSIWHYTGTPGSMHILIVHHKYASIKEFKGGIGSLSSFNFPLCVISKWHGRQIPPYKGPFTNTCLRGFWCKKGALQIYDPCKGALTKKYHKFSSKNWVKMLFYGVDPNFHGKKRGPLIFLGWKGAPILIFASGPPYKFLWTLPNILRLNTITRSKKLFVEKE